MIPTETIQQILWVGANCLVIVLVLRLLQLRLYRLYPWFLAFLVLSVSRTILLAGLDPGSDTYADRWAASEPLLMLVQAGFVLEVFRLTARPYPALGRFGSWALGALLGLAFVFAAATMEVERAAVDWWGHWIRIVSFVRRFVSSALALFLILTTAFFAFVPVPNHRNVRIHRILSTVYFAVWAAGMLLVHLRMADARVSGLFLLVGSSACFLAWIVLFSEQPVEKSVVATEEEKAAIEERAAAALGFLRDKSRSWRG